MKGKGKKVLSMLLSCCMVCSMGSFYPVSAAEGSTKEDLIRYEKDYEDGDTGVWEGAEASIIEDPDNPGNHVLELKNFEAGATGRNFGREASAPAIADGTLSMKVKGISSNETFYRMGFIYRAEDVASEANQLTESGGWLYATRVLIIPVIPNIPLWKSMAESRPTNGSM